MHQLLLTKIPTGCCEGKTYTADVAGLPTQKIQEKDNCTLARPEIALLNVFKSAKNRHFCPYFMPHNFKSIGWSSPFKKARELGNNCCK